MFSENSLKLIANMIDGVQLKPSDANFAMMAQAFEVLKKELQEVINNLKKGKENDND